MIDWFANEVVLKLLASVLVGGLIGAEREYRSKAAGLRTMTLICLGSTVFTVLSDYLEGGQTARIAANIVTGIGFLGAGVIFKTDDRVQGLTTAAIVWVTASLGMAIGEGHLRLSLAGTVLTFGVLVLFKRVERLLERFRQSRHYRIAYRYASPDDYRQYRKLLRPFKASVTRGEQTIANGLITGNWTVRARPEEQERLLKALLTNPNVKEITF
jgi:putative Mg2+ transporter-C (MgtC) family protein